MSMLKSALQMLVFLAFGLGVGLLVRNQLDGSSGEADIRRIDRAAMGVPATTEPIMLSLSTCPVCSQARAWLKQRNIAHTEMTLDESVEAQRLADALELDAVPVFLIGDQQITGFDPELLESLLAHAAPL